MDNQVIEFFKRFGFLRLDDLIEIYKLSSLKSFKEGEVIAEKGQVYNYTIGIRKGIIRTYVLTPGGEEKTVRFAKEGDFTSCANSFLLDQASTEYLMAVEDCKVILMDHKRLKTLGKDNIRILRLINEATADAFSDAVGRIEFFVTLNPEERYTYLLQHSPDLLSRVPQKYLASFIGVTTVSLSRIRSRLSQNPKH